MSYFKVEHLTVRFGGLTAVDDVSFDVDEGQVFSIIGPNGAGKTTLFNLISRLYQPTTGRIEFRGEDVTRLSAQEIAGRGIARTFQNIELFESASTLQNLLVGRHRHSTTRIWQDILRTPKARAEEIEHRRAVELVIDVCSATATRLSAACLTACARWSRWLGHCALGPACCCWTSLRRA